MFLLNIIGTINWAKVIAIVGKNRHRTIELCSKGQGVESIHRVEIPEVDPNPPNPNVAVHIRAISNAEHKKPLVLYSQIFNIDTNNAATQMELVTENQTGIITWSEYDRRPLPVIVYEDDLAGMFRLSMEDSNRPKVTASVKLEIEGENSIKNVETYGTPLITELDKFQEMLLLLHSFVLDQI